MFGFDLPLWALSLIAGGRKFLSGAVSFFSKPPGTYIGLVLLIILAWWWSGQRGYDRGEKQGKADCETAHASAVVREVARQKDVGIAVTRASEARTTQATVKDRQNREIVADVKARAESLPPPPAECPAAVPADLADRLRDLR